MSGCVEFQSSMTGSRREGLLQPPDDSAPLLAGVTTSSSSSSTSPSRSSYRNRHQRDKNTIKSPSHRQTLLQREIMTPVRSTSGQPIQLTPLWEHVVRTKQFPAQVDTRETFDEISDRLRDPEWEVRQHALRVLVDVLPTLDTNAVDEAMISVLPELINNLGHVAPAVRKGALDALRVYLLCSQQREEIVERILDEGLTRPEALDNFQTNVTLGVILSTPSLLFPSSSSPRPSRQLLTQAIGTLATRLIQLAHQEASVRSLVKIHEIIGSEEFESCLSDLDGNAKRDYEVLCDVYEVKPSSKNWRKRSGKKTKRKKNVANFGEKVTEEKEAERRNKVNENCDSCCIPEKIENEKQIVINCPITNARILLETEIKFNEETAITMTILEEDKNIDSQAEESESSEEILKDEEIVLQVKNNFEESENIDYSTDAWIERRKTPRRVHFGGEIVKLRTPDSEDNEIIETEVSQTRIPLPITKTTKMRSIRPRRSLSNPSSPNVVKSNLRKSRSASNSPKRELYTHDASLSPKKSILTKNNSLVKLIDDVTRINPSICNKILESKVDQLFGKEEDDGSWAFEICDSDLPVTSKLQKFERQNSSKSSREKRKKILLKNNNETRKISEIVDSSMKENLKVEKIEMADESTSDNIAGKSLSGRDSEVKRRRNSLIMNIELGRTSEIGDNETKEDPEVKKIELPDGPISDDIREKSSDVERSQSSRSRRNSLKPGNDGFSQIGEVENDVKFEKFELVTDDSLARSLSGEKSKVTKKRRNSLKINIEVERTKEIDVNELKGEKLELSGESVVDDTAKSSVSMEKHEKTDEAKEENNEEEMNQKDSQEVEEKLRSEIKSSEFHRRSPHSPKKLAFESFPRKERNYILMELSSPVKTNGTKSSEIDDEYLGVPLNGEIPSRGNSPMGYSADQSFVASSVSGQVDEALRDKNLRTWDKIEKMEPSDESPSPVQKIQESSWEELGLVDREVLNDLHNKDDWRARVRGLERVASALRTSSALIAIESRLGSLLQEVLGGDRSCRVAAAGMAVARVVVAGVSEEALKRRLPQVAWGLARQGGPNAAQLARVAMLRLRPALFLEQLLQPHCIRARNAKTRENALQLLIFSLVTFPSTEFKVENVGNKVATMVADKRRRVRQAALDTLAVLAQIYEPEEVMQAGKLAAKGQQDGDAMLAAIRARLARKSLPMVSADGLVVYGLQISPTVQIATGPDVDWIVAGSGSVSPGTGRTRGQIIATTRVREKNSKNETKSEKNVCSSERPNFVALGIGLKPKNEQHQPLAWQLVQSSSAQNECNKNKDKLWIPENHENSSNGFENNLDVVESRLTGSLRYYRSATDRLSDSFDSEAAPIFILDDKDVIMKQRKTEENFHRRMDEIYAERTGIGPTAANRLESRIPVRQPRNREINGRNSRIGTNYTRRRNQEENNSQNWSASSRGSETSRPRSIRRSEPPIQPEVNAQRYQRIARDVSPERLSPTRDTYRSIYKPRRGYADGNVYREVQTAPTTTSYDVSRRRQSLRDSELASRMLQSQERRKLSTEFEPSESRSRRLANGLVEGYRLSNPSVFSGDKAAVDEQDHNEINKRHFSVQTNPYRIQNLSDRSVQFPDRSSNGRSETSSNDSSNTSGEDGRQEIHQKLESDRQRVIESFVASEVEMIRGSPCKSPMIEKSFDVITHVTNMSRKNSIDYELSENEGLASIVVYSTDPENEEYETDKGTSTDEASVVPGAQSCQRKFVETRVDEEANDEDDNNDIDIDDDDDDDDENDDDHNDNDNEHDDNDESSEVEEQENHSPSARNVAASSFLSNESNSSYERFFKVSDDSPVSNVSCDIVDGISNSAKSPSRVHSMFAFRSIENVAYENSRSSTDDYDATEATAAFVREYSNDKLRENEITRSVVSPKFSKASTTEAFFQQPQVHRNSTDEEIELPAVRVASRPHSRDPSEDAESSLQTFDSRQSQDVIAIGSSAATRVAATSTQSLAGRVANESPKKPSFTALPDEPTISLEVPRESSMSTLTTTTTTMHEKINRSSSIGNGSAVIVPEVIETQNVTSDNTVTQKRIPTSKVSRVRQKTRMNISKVAPMPTSQNSDKTPHKSKSITQQWFTQLESNDWEVVVKGLKALSQIARQHPEQLDSCAPGTLGRLLGRHVRNLRSQVSRAACLAAGDVFGSQARCIDQDLDNIAGPLLHRTADTNKFLRADSNNALNRMVEHLPPNKTILVIVHRGATHQNAIVRAATARLLVSIVDRLGTDWPISLPRDVREKLIATGAKLLMDGNLEARNYAKGMIRKLGRWEGFRKALKDCVPEATLRHIDKTLKSL